MFKHIFYYRFKQTFRNKETTFWNILFPIILGTLFYVVLTDAYNYDKFEQIQIAVVSDDNYNSTMFITSIESVSNVVTKEFMKSKDFTKTDENDLLFLLTYLDEAEAKELLLQHKIYGYITLKDDITLTVNGSGFEQNVIKQFIDSYKQKESTVINAVNINQGEKTDEIINLLNSQKNYVASNNSSNPPKDIMMVHFFTLIAMACLYGSYFGIISATDLQADLSATASRVNITRVSKFKMTIGYLTTAYTFQLITLSILVFYLFVVLRLNLGKHIFLIFLTCLIGALIGLLFGVIIGFLIKKDVHFKQGLAIGITMLCCFLSGMMSLDMKYLVRENAPLLCYINPIELITDSLYSLYYFDNYDRYLIDTINLLIICFVLSILVFLKLRGKRYESA